MEYVLIAQTMWGPMSEATAKSNQTRIFQCGHCSDSEIQVYHNILGQHLHQAPEDTKARLALARQINQEAKGFTTE